MDEFRGKVAVVTGAASGIGLGLAQRFAAEGMRVVLSDVEVPALEAAVGDLTAQGFDAIGVPTDVSDAAGVEALAQRTLDAFGAVHVVCNNAGVEPQSLLRDLTDPVPMWEEPLEEWQWVIGVNFWGVVHGIRSFVPILIEQREPSYIVNTSSTAGFQTRPGGGAYGASKHAVVRVTEGLHLQLARSHPHVKVSLLAPGAVTTRIASAYRNQPAAVSRIIGEPTVEGQETLDREMAALGGKQPSEAAEIVIQGMREERFYIFTDRPFAESRVRERAEGIVSGLNPADLPRFAEFVAGGKAPRS